MSWIDEQYINRVGYRLDLFTRQSATLYRCRCPICGDSAKRKDITRGYFIYRDGTWRYYCHNCSANLTIKQILNVIDPILADEYSLDQYKEKYRLVDKPAKKELTAADIPKARLPEFKKTIDPPSGLIPFDQMSSEHPAVMYLEGRKIPREAYSRLFFAPKFRKWNSPLIKKKYDDRFPDHPRLVIPYYWTDGSIFRYSSRAFGKESPRYQQTNIDETKPRLYGLERLDFDDRTFVLEGQIDSLFLPNALAVGSANYNIPLLNSIENKIFVPDNQPRNPDVVKQFGSLVDAGHKVCIWKEDYGKDINKMVIDHNLSQSDLVRMILESTYSGIEAKLYFNRWKKC